MVKRKKRKEDLKNAGIAGASYEAVQRYGSAVKEHQVAYSGVNNESGAVLVKGLKQIAKEAVNPDYQFQNIHQQAGFSAEVKDVARFNAESIISGNPSRKIRTDDLGRINDPLYDTVLLNAKGEIVDGSGGQIKFLGLSGSDPSGAGNAARALEKLRSKKFEKYLNHNVTIDVPTDQYDKIIGEANGKIEDLMHQLRHQKNVGSVEQIQKIQGKIDKLKKIKKLLRKSPVSSNDAVFAHLHPTLSTVIDVTKISHRAGIQTGKMAVAMEGSISIVKNVVSFCKREAELEDASKETAKDLASAAAVGYGTGFWGSAIKGTMQNSRFQSVRTLSKSNVPGTIAAASVSAAKTFSRYFKGEMDEVECFRDLGEQGTGMISSAMFALVGQAAIPIPIVGGLAGSMVGYALSSASYGILVQSLEEKKFAAKERGQIEKICEEHIEMIRSYRVEIEQVIHEYLSDSMDIFREAFLGIKNALSIGDADWFIENANEITERMGGTVAFSNMKEFEEEMHAGRKFRL